MPRRRIEGMRRGTIAIAALALALVPAAQAGADGGQPATKEDQAA